MTFLQNFTSSQNSSGLAATSFLIGCTARSSATRAAHLNRDYKLYIQVRYSKASGVEITLGEEQEFFNEGSIDRWKVNVATVEESWTQMDSRLTAFQIRTISKVI